jgi:hypothetical protein
MFLWDGGFQTPGEFAPGEQYAPPAAFAFQTNIRSQAGDHPLVGSAWMRFAQAQQVIQLQVGQHEAILTRLE